MSNKDRKKLDNILKEKLSQQRMMLGFKLKAARLPENAQPFGYDELKLFLDALPVTTAEEKKEIQNALAAARTGTPVNEPDVSTPEKQLIWGATLGHIMVDPEVMANWDIPTTPQDFSSSPLWKSLTLKNRYVLGELISHATHIREALRNSNTLHNWVTPGAGTKYDPEKKHIKIDLMENLISGMEHARADVNREIGYSLLTKTYPKEMRDVIKKMQPLIRKSQQAVAKKGPQLSQGEYKELRMLNAEFQLRKMMFDAAEENTIGRYVDNLGKGGLQDYGVSLHNTGVTARSLGLTRLPQGDDVSEDLKRYMNLVNAVKLSFYQKNGLFDNSDEEWQKSGVVTDWVRTTKTLKNRKKTDPEVDGKGITHDDFELLRQLCSGRKGLENLQPSKVERMFGQLSYERSIERNDARRNDVVEKIWELFSEDLIQKILEQTNDQLDQDLENAEQEQEQDGQPQDGQPQDGDPQDGDPQDGDPQDGDPQDGQPQDGQPQDGQPQDGQPQDGQPQDGQPQDGQPQDGQPQDGQPQDGQPQDGQPQDGQPQDGDPQDGDPQDGDPQDGQPQDGQPQDGQPQDGQPQDGQDQGQQQGQEQDAPDFADEGMSDDGSTVPVEGAGDMPAVDMPSEEPGKEPGQDADGQDGDSQDGQDGQDQDGQDGQDQDGQDGDSQDGDSQDGDGQQGEAQDGDGQDGQTLEEMQQQAEQMDQDGQDGQDGESQDGQDAQDGQDGDSNDADSGTSNQTENNAGQGEGKSLEQLSQESWTDYNKRVSELYPYIVRVKKLFKQIQEQQTKRVKNRSASLELIPENGEVMDRFNLEAHKNLTIKRAMNDVEETDLNRFHKDEYHEVPTELDVVIMIDGSGSMTGVPLNSALQAAAILREGAASKDMKINVYVGLWGNEEAPMIVTPDMTPQQVGAAMEGARNGLHSGTDMAPSVKRVAKTIGEEKSKGGALSGYTHVLYLSDGDINDDHKTKKNIETLFRASDKVTVDVAVLRGRAGSRMEQAAKAVKGRGKSQEVGVTLDTNPNTIPLSIVGLLADKMRKCGSFTPIPNTKKRRQMKNAANKMGKR